MAKSVKAGKRSRVRRVATPPVAPAPGLCFRRLFSTAGTDPMDTVEWALRSAAIHNAAGDAIFEQQDIETPSFWSDMALNVVASRYFRGSPGTPERETSIRALVLRVVDTIGQWGVDQGYFASPEDTSVFRDELLHLVIHQKASFNSPVWFNVGIEEKPQCSACFILSVEDTMESILDWYREEGMIFKGGSGAGVNVSNLRSSRESLGGGGTASGPVSFMRAADASAGVIKSGGKTRRAAKMVILNIDHPDVLEFIRCKAIEERKARILAHMGYGSALELPHLTSIGFQNSNHSVRVTDEFMEADRNDEPWHTRFVLTNENAGTYQARELMRELAAAAHECGDPGLQFDTIINRWHTCPKTAPIRASNPCSEYMHVDESACNLGSLRLTAFLDDTGDFRVDEFRHAVDIMITAQDILVDKASYPSAAIETNSRNMRALGLGYADLGALLMQRGIPYDSDVGRAWASAITSIMTGEAYGQSARIAAIRGAFPEFERNRKLMLGVLQEHLHHTAEIKSAEAPHDLVKQAAEIWTNALELGWRHGYRNCQTTVLAPTGTVAFMMDCDTTGVEPELALVKYKSLSGGGQLKIVNRSVASALNVLNYPSETIKHVLDHIERTGTVEGIAELRPEHQEVFDCSFRPVGGQRFVSAQGHLLMLAAVQPFLSGAISKTVNLPHDTSVEEIEEIFRMAWRLGLKSIAVYRDGCKTAQPLALAASQSDQGPMPVRRRLTVDCKTVRHKFEIAGQKGYIHTGFYEDGRVGEIFIRISKEGSTVSGLMDTIATLTSIALQYGVPLEALVNKFSHVRFEPSGFTSNPDIPIAKSLTDYIFRYLGTRFLNKEQQEAAGLIPGSDLHSAPGGSYVESTGNAHPHGAQGRGHLFRPQSDAPACQDCGVIMVRRGACYECVNCGATYGCS
jgi:ribonucleoside-diphosphate reductase alpha chain